MEDVIINDRLEAGVRPGVSVAGVGEGGELRVEPGLDVGHDLLEGVRHHRLHLRVRLVELHQRRRVEVAAEDDKVSVGAVHPLDQLLEVTFVVLSCHLVS